MPLVRHRLEPFAVCAAGGRIRAASAALPNVRNPYVRVEGGYVGVYFDIENAHILQTPEWVAGAHVDLRCHITVVHSELFRNLFFSSCP